MCYYRKSDANSDAISEIVSVQDAIKVLQRTVMGSVTDRLVLDIRRAFVILDSLKEARKEKFNPCKFVKVSY